MPYDPKHIPEWENVHPTHRAAVVREMESRLAELYAQHAAAATDRRENPGRPSGAHDELGNVITGVVADHTAQMMGAYIAALKKLDV